MSCSGSSPNWIAAAWTDVQDCHDNYAVDGETIMVGSGASASVTSVTTINKAISIIGPDCPVDSNGRAVTPCPVQLTNNNTVGVGAVLAVTLVTGKLTRISNIQIIPGTGVQYQGSIYFNGDDADGTRFRLDHVVMSNTIAEKAGADPAVDWFGAWGVVDHSTFTSDKAVGLGHTFGTGNGDDVWFDGMRFGTDKTVVFEDCNIISTGGSLTPKLDAHAGGQYTVRKSTLYNNALGSHGLEGNRQRGAHAFEFYNNLFDLPNGAYAWADQGTGTTMIHNNWLYGTGAIDLVLKSYRMWDCHDPWSIADGRNQWDVNDAGNPFATGTVSSTGSFSVTCSTCNFGTTNYAGYSVRKTGGPSVKTCTQIVQVSGNVYRVSCTGHGFTSSDVVCIYGAALNSGNKSAFAFFYSAAFTNPTISNIQTDTFDITLRDSAGTPANVTSGEILATIGHWASAITGNDATTINYVPSLYTVHLAFSPDDTFEINKITHVMDGAGRDLGSYIDPGDVPPNLPGGWNDQVTIGSYQWLNKRCPSSPPTVNCGSATTDVNYASDAQIIENVHYYDWFSGFDGTVGMGSGTRAQMDAISTCAEGVAFWVTDEGEWDSTHEGYDGRMYKCSPADTWTLYYTPLAYPHPLITDVPATSLSRRGARLLLLQK